MSKSSDSKRLVPCMPPLLREETIPLSRQSGSTNYGGTACENLVKSYFLSRQINIAEPHVDDGVDLLVEKNSVWVRGQVKKVVYQYKLDHGIKSRNDVEVYRSRFCFNFQGSGNVPHLKNGRRQRTPKEVDYFYHVLLTPHRQLIWETPVNIIPVRKDGTFIHGKNPVLDRDSVIRKKAEIDYNELLIYQHYDPIIFQSYPNFFIKKPTNTLTKFFDYEISENPS